MPRIRSSALPTLIFARAAARRQDSLKNYRLPSRFVGERPVQEQPGKGESRTPPYPAPMAGNRIERLSAGTEAEGWKSPKSDCGSASGRDGHPPSHGRPQTQPRGAGCFFVTEVRSTRQFLRAGGVRLRPACGPRQSETEQKRRREPNRQERDDNHAFCSEQIAFHLFIPRARQPQAHQIHLIG